MLVCQTVYRRSADRCEEENEGFLSYDNILLFDGGSNTFFAYVCGIFTIYWPTEMLYNHWKIDRKINYVDLYTQ